MTITQLHPEAPAADLTAMLEATRTHLQLWQRGTLKFVPSQQEILQRHVTLFRGAGDQLRATAQRLVAELSTDALTDILAAQEATEFEELLSLATDEASAVLRRLAAQIDLVRREQLALLALPLLDPNDSVQRVMSQRERNSTEQTALQGEITRLGEDLKVVEASINALVNNGLEIEFGGVVPSLETLNAFAAPGGEALLTVQAVSKAIEDLRNVLGDIIEGMRYGQLNDQAMRLRARIATDQERLREMRRRDGELADQLSVLEQFPQLSSLREAAAGDLARVLLGLQQLHAAIADVALTDRAGVAALDTAFNRLRTLEREIVTQLTR
ncbi:alpha-xenorhabdolysin family binary toxin subunit B [Pseudomonas cremoricolorata]|uniref:Uncharacterized protein n=1 Tax=Pseudomonas cremoricolorata TaxID=157783 RepID=A0A089Y7P2_9PSED|nr:alpha-xenorhabdolysin family binary toxin subunit B [Pseudomonas cremoricolorata]AIR87873.1 hypothetical protein LK03_00865 [Pseudomonas cremoricolorata]